MQPPPLRLQQPRPCCPPAAAAAQAAPPPADEARAEAARAAAPAFQDPLGLAEELDEEIEHLCLELASVAALPAAEEAALLGLGDPAGREATFYILGTAHISEQSCRDAAALIRVVRPQFVFLELCKERAAMLGSEVRIRAPTLGEAAELLRSGRGYTLLHPVLVEARAVGARYVLGDRPISVTVARMWASLSGWEKAQLLCSLLYTAARSKADKQELQQEIERLKGSDALTQAVGEFARDFPGIIGPLVTERDKYMVYVMRRLAAYGDRIVAVVGAGHLAGIREHWEGEISLQELMRLPENK
ncbi:hypothetical protein ABPG75_002385 [Micractinium tetrahymenae]